MMTEEEKWRELYDDEEFIEILKSEGWTPESSSGMSTADIERERDLRLYREANWNSCNDDNVLIFMKSLAVVGGVIGIGYTGYKLIKNGCQKIKDTVEKHKQKKKEQES